MFFIWGGYHLYFTIQQKIVKNEMKHRIRNTDPEAVQTFHFSEKQYAVLEWEDDAEFFFQGKMYDVIEKQANRKGVVIICIEDQVEHELIKAEMRAREHSDKKGAGLIKLIAASFILPKGIELREESLSKQVFPVFKQDILQIHPAEILRPPERV